MKEEIRRIMGLIARNELLCEVDSMDQATYNDQRLLINSLFNNTDYNIGSIILRLTVIDSLYSTNAAYSYFSFEEMATSIYNIGSSQKTKDGKRRAERDYFYHVALTGEDNLGLFGEPYGFQKNLSEGTKQMSLLSKYAYYELMQERERYPIGFPIYDRLAREAYPIVRKMLGEKDFYSMPSLETPSIKQYITCLTQLRKGLFDDNKLFEGYQQFDILDAYLWRMGKFSDGNLSLLLGRSDYVKFIVNLGMDAPVEKGKTTRRETVEYKEKLNRDYAHFYPGKDKCDFNLLILAHLMHDKCPFKGISQQEYMTALLSHWREFRAYNEKHPKRGIKFPADLLTSQQL